MEVITIEHSAFLEMKRMYFEICDKHNSLDKEYAKTNIKLLTVSDVAEMLNYTAKTIYDRKEEIGYIKNGKEIRFERSNVEAWIKKNSIKPKIK